MTQSTLSIRRDVPLAPFTTFGIGGPATYFVDASTEHDVAAAVAWADQQHLPLFVLGGGSNVLIRDAGFTGLVLRISMPGLAISPDSPEVIDAGAGVPWETVVNLATAANLAGMECLAGIPGSAGGTPVQNVGAYGQEVSETIASVRAFDRKTLSFVDLPKLACRFRYRESLFNTDEPNRYIVTRVHYRLTLNGAPNLRYADLRRHFEKHSSPPTLAEVASAVRDIRQAKGMLLMPDDPDCRSAGSFFKNPIVPSDALPRVAAAAGVDSSSVPHWPVPQHPGHIKLAAAWLLEHAGFVRGYHLGSAAISSRHTLALINPGHATCAAIEALQDQIVTTVCGRFGITLAREPVLIG